MTCDDSAWSGTAAGEQAKRLNRVPERHTLRDDRRKCLAGTDGEWLTVLPDPRIARSGDGYDTSRTRYPQMHRTLTKPHDQPVD